MRTRLLVQLGAALAAGALRAFRVLAAAAITRGGVIAMLAVLGGADNQVKGHVAGDLAVGNTRAQLLAVLTVLVPFIGYPRTLNALAAVDAVTGD